MHRDLIMKQPEFGWPLGGHWYVPSTSSYATILHMFTCFLYVLCTVVCLISVSFWIQTWHVLHFFLSQKWLQVRQPLSIM
jgi:hypothetical protein